MHFGGPSVRLNTVTVRVFRNAARRPTVAAAGRFFLCGHHNANASAVFGGSFAPILRFEKLEIHKVFLHFPNLVLKQNLSPNALADLRCAALSSATSIPVPALRPFVDAHGVGFASVRWLLLQRRGILLRRVSSLEMGVKFSRYRATFR